VWIPTHRPPTTPGELLEREFLKPLNMTQTAFAKHIGIGRDRLNDIIHGRRAVTPETAMRLSAALGTTVQFWLNVQLAVDLRKAQQSQKIAKAVKRIPPLCA
jgi:addiction module HigA family antidote